MVRLSVGIADVEEALAERLLTQESSRVPVAARSGVA